MLCFARQWRVTWRGDGVRAAFKLLLLGSPRLGRTALRAARAGAARACWLCAGLRAPVFYARKRAARPETTQGRGADHAASVSGR